MWLPELETRLTVVLPDHTQKTCTASSQAEVEATAKAETVDNPTTTRVSYSNYNGNHNRMGRCNLEDQDFQNWKFKQKKLFQPLGIS